MGRLIAVHVPDWTRAFLPGVRYGGPPAMAYPRALVRRWRFRLREAPRRSAVPEVLGVSELGDHVVTVRLLRATDFEAWHDARVANEARMRPWWPEVEDWDKAHGAADFVAHLNQWRHLSRTGRGLGLVIDLDGRLVGEILVWDMMPGGGTAEAGIWAEPRAGAPEVLAALVIFMDHAYSVVGLRRISAPVAKGNHYPVRLLGFMGFQSEGCLRGLRTLQGAPVDYEMYSLLVDDWRVARPKVERMLKRRIGSQPG